MKYYIVAGEASGDLHGSNLVKHIYQQDTEASIRCWGGDLMAAQGAEVVKHYRDLAFMGFVEVLKNLPTILKNLSFCKRDIEAFKPDVIVLIDYPGFNIKIAEWAKPLGFKVVYYISPQVWAWKANRVHTLKRNVDRMLVILPFEKAFYHKYQYNVEYVGHPLVEVVEAARQNTSLTLQAGKPIVALLPGSRKQEIAAKLPIMLEVSKAFPQYQFIVAGAPAQPQAFYQHMMAPYKNVSLVINQTYALLNSARAALVTSGTATLETALFGVPEVVCYKGNPISYAIARRVVKIEYISLVNLIMNKPVVKELIQQELTVANCTAELEALLHNEQYRSQMQHYFNALRQLLAGGGAASANAARLVVAEARREQ